MAEHNLRITAQLDTSELNSELDRLNQQRGGGGTNDTTGNGISLGMRLRQLQLSLDNLNRTLQNMMRRSGAGGGGEGKGLGDSKTLGAMMGSDKQTINRFARASLGSELIEKGLISKTAWDSETRRKLFFNSPEG